MRDRLLLRMLHSFVSVYPSNDPVLATLKHYEEESKKRKHTQSSEEEESDDNAFIGPQLSDVNTRVEAISEQEIYTNRLSVDEIIQIEKFKDYKAGKESPVCNSVLQLC